MDIQNGLRLREAQQIIVAHQRAFPISKPLAAKVLLGKTEPLDHRPHRPVKDEDAVGEEGLQFR